jgi:hypothetical protein
MNSAIKIVHEGKRGCGYRVEKGIYFRSDGSTIGCGKFPIELTVCPCCNQGIKPSRSFQWINLSRFIEGKSCDGGHRCDFCPASDKNLSKLTKCGLLFVGAKFYRTPEAFVNEAMAMGISRRINFVPKEFKLGESWVALAHEKAIPRVVENQPVTYTTAIFSLFKPDRIEIVVSGQESDEVIESYLRRGLSPVLVINPEKGESS